MPEQRGWSKRLVAALLLLFLLPSFVSLNPAPTPVSKPVLRPTPLAHAQPPYSNEKEFIDYVTNVLNRHSSTYLKKMSEKLGEHLYIFWKREIGVSGTALKQGTVEYQWAAQVISRLAAEGELAGEDLTKAWSEILAERKCHVARALRCFLNAERRSVGWEFGWVGLSAGGGKGI